MTELPFWKRMNSEFTPDEWNKLNEYAKDMNKESEIETLKSLQVKINAEIKDFYKEQHDKRIQDNKQYIGKTFKQKNNYDDSVSYYKIIYPDINNEYRFHTFVFTLPFKIDFTNSWAIQDDLCEFDSIGFLCTEMLRHKHGEPYKKEIDYYNEITDNEFNEKLDEWYRLLKENLNCRGK